MDLRLFLLICCFTFSATTAAGGDPLPAADSGILKPDNPVLTYKVQRLDRSAGDKFVLIEISRVINPEAVPLAFTVHYRKSGQKELYLGGFALYPADNPGIFIVPVQGKVSQDGEIFLTMEPLQNQGAAKSVQVKVREVRLTNSLD